MDDAYRLVRRFRTARRREALDIWTFPESAKKVLSKHGDKLFLTGAEFNAYVKRSPIRDEKKEMLILVSKNMKKYSRPVGYNKPLTTAGQYFELKNMTF